MLIKIGWICIQKQSISFSICIFRCKISAFQVNRRCEM